MRITDSFLKDHLMIRKYWLFPLILILFSILSCKNTATDTASDFDNFYKKFHRDSLFQKASITFPLPGFPSFADSLTIESGDFYWQEKDWSIQQEVDFESGEFERELQILDNLVVERVFLQEGVFIERRFYKNDDKWKLIYYSDLNFGERQE